MLRIVLKIVDKLFFYKMPVDIFETSLTEKIKYLTKMKMIIDI